LHYRRFCCLRFWRGKHWMMATFAWSRWRFCFCWHWKQ